MIVLLSTEKAFCEATAVQQVQTVVQPTVAVEKTATPESGYINPSLGGEATTLTSSFKLQANDEVTFFVVYSNIQIDGGQAVSAFDMFGNLMFANTTYLPSANDANNARANISGNANIIVYPFTLNGKNIKTAFNNRRSAFT